MPRLWDTCTAATNWPRFLNPCDAVCRLVPGGNRPASLLESLVLCDKSSEGDFGPEPVSIFPELPCAEEEAEECEFPILEPAALGGPPPWPPPCWAQTG